MFSDLSFSTLPRDIPHLDTHPDEDLAPLNFDDLLDIAREFEFTRTITHIWPCEEPSIRPEIETGLEDILATIMPTPNAEESPLPSSTPPIHPEPVQEVDFHESVSIPPAPDKSENIPVPLPKDNDQVRAEAGYLIASVLRGWSPPNGSQFLDLDEGLALPQSVTDMRISPWLATLFAPSYTQPERSINPSFATAHPIGDIRPLASATGPKAPPVSTTAKAVDNPRCKIMPSSVGRAVLEPVQVGPTLQGNANAPLKTPHAKTPKPRVHPRSTPSASAVTYAKAPRGGIPPHIARTVTKANILRIEKERKVMQDAFSGTTMGEGKKPSVLRRAARVEKECGRGSGKKGDEDEEEGRTAKRARV